jgi:hypothetical protein
MPRRKNPASAMPVVSKIDGAPTTIAPAIRTPATAQARVTCSRVKSLVADLNYRLQRRQGVIDSEPNVEIEISRKMPRVLLCGCLGLLSRGQRLGKLVGGTIEQGSDHHRNGEQNQWVSEGRRKWGKIRGGKIIRFPESDESDSL